MKIRVLCFGAFRDHLPEDAEGNAATLEVAPEATVGDVVDSLGAPRKLAFSVLMDGERSGLEAPVHEGAEITLMPPFAGGERSVVLGVRWNQDDPTPGGSDG